MFDHDGRFAPVGWLWAIGEVFAGYFGFFALFLLIAFIPYLGR
jgi:hypothetical protein